MSNMFHDNNYVLTHLSNNQIPYLNLTDIYHNFGGMTNNPIESNYWGKAGNDIPNFDELFEQIATNNLLFSQELLVNKNSDHLWRLFLSQINQKFGKHVTLIRSDNTEFENHLIDKMNVVEIPWFEQYLILKKPKKLDYSGLKREDTLTEFDFNLDLDKPYIFSALLGGEKAWRSELYENIKNNPNIIITYRGKYPDLNKEYEATPEEYKYFTYEYDYFSLPSEEKANSDLAMRVPSKIYENSLVDLVVETYFGLPVFLTEKTGKPIIAKRPFILYASAYTLKNLKRFGYKSFPRLFDESYDEIPNNNLRKQKILHEIENLNKKKLAEHKNYIEDIVEHNYNVYKDKTFQLRNHLDDLLANN